MIPTNRAAQQDARMAMGRRVAEEEAWDDEDEPNRFLVPTAVVRFSRTRRDARIAGSTSPPRIRRRAGSRGGSSSACCSAWPPFGFG